MMRLGIVLTLLSFALTSPKVLAEDPVLEGNYTCIGDNGDGTNYRGTVKITKNGDTYLVQWTIAGGTHVGIGLLHDKTLSTSWATNAGGKLVKGVAVYKIDKNRLVGQWAQFPGNGKIMSEIMTKQE